LVCSDPDRYVFLFSQLTLDIRDAGLVLSSYIASISCLSDSPAPVNTLPRLPSLETTLSKPDLNVLELGAGCGIVGITLAHTLPKPHIILLTDLPEATEILTHNLSASILSKHAPISHQVLDWSFPLPSNVAAMKWNLVVVADCTYNPDVVPDLVKTLGEVADGNQEVMVLLAMKVRHESEMVFFDLMKERRFVVREKCALPLPVLGGEEEEIEIFVFGYGVE
jgi:predicted nicotinamide N-methyase